MMLRYQGLQGDFPKDARPKAAVARISEIYNYRPVDEPRFGPEERKAQIAARQEHLKRQYSY